MKRYLTLDGGTTNTRIRLVENGEIIERGDHDDLLAQKGRYYELYTGLKELT